MGAPGGCACKSSCNNLRNTFASSMGVGNRSVRVNVLGEDTQGFGCVGASSRFRCNSCAASARALNRAHTCSSMRFSKNASGSSRTMGYSSSTLSAKISRGSNTRKLRDAAPRASFCRWSPGCPRRSLTGTSGRAASARSLRMPQRSNVSTQRAASAASEEKLSSNTSTGRSPSCSASRPSGIKVTPGKPRAASKAASGFAATARFASSPICETRCAKSRAIFGSGPSNGSRPARFRSTMPSEVSSTSGENDCAQSSSATCAQRQVFPRFELRLGRAYLHARLPRSFVERHHLLQRRPSGEHRDRTGAQLWLKANDRLHRKIGDEDAGKHGSAALSCQLSVKAYALNHDDEDDDKGFLSLVTENS